MNDKQMMRIEKWAVNGIMGWMQETGDKIIIIMI